MVANNSGFRKLQSLVEHVLKCRDDGQLRSWYGARWGIISSELDRMCHNPVVDQFVSASAMTLGEELRELLSFPEATEVSIDFTEGLVRQTKLYEESLTDEICPPAIQPLLPNITEESNSNIVAANSNMAMAA